MSLSSYIFSLDDNFLLQLKTVDGKIDLSIGIFCTIIAFLLSELIVKNALHKRFNLHAYTLKNLGYFLAIRLAFPVTALGLYLLNYCRFLLMTNKVSVVYPAMMWLAGWMALIRVIIGLMIFIFPRGTLRYTLGNAFSLLLWLVFFLWWTNSYSVLEDFLSSINVAIGPIHFTPLSLTYSLGLALIIISISLWVNRLIELKITQTRRFDHTIKHIILRLTKIIIFIVIAFSVLPIFGVNLTTLSIFSGALGVGVGIGLQRIMGNIFSGILILMDRSIKIGDRLVVGEHTGYVTKITSRHIILQGLDNSEILVPNNKFIFEIIVNQSYTDTILLTKLNLSVAYGSNLELALQLMREVAQSHPLVSGHKLPEAGIVGFGDYAIQLELLVWVGDPKLSLTQPKTDIYLAIIQQFALHKIEIPLPSQTIKLERSGDSTVVTSNDSRRLA